MFVSATEQPVVLERPTNIALVAIRSVSIPQSNRRLRVAGGVADRRGYLGASGFTEAGKGKYFQSRFAVQTAR